MTPKEAAQKAHEHPAETGGLFVAIGLLLKVTAVIKLVSYLFIGVGLVFLWEAFKPKANLERNEA